MLSALGGCIVIVVVNLLVQCARRNYFEILAEILISDLKTTLLDWT